MINNKTFPENDLQEEEDLIAYFLMRAKKLPESTAREVLSLNDIINSIEADFPNFEL
jgi:hypothetical protein